MPEFKDEVIEIVPVDLDCRPIVEKLAAQYPSIYWELIDPENGWRSDCRRMYRNNRLIDAIKLWRAKTGDDLRTSKEAVERMCKGL